MSRAAIVLLLLAVIGFSWVYFTSDSEDTQHRESAVLNIALVQPLSSFDPWTATTDANQLIQRQVFEGLVEYDYLTRPFTVKPALAESWSTSADGLNWTFQLRKDANFYDPWEPALWPEGTRSVTAHDVIYSWMRQADPNGRSQCYWAFEGLFPGLDRFRGQATGKAWEWDRQPVEGLRAVDDHTLEIRLGRPASELLYFLASPYAVVIPPEAVARGDFGNRPVGSGAFHLAEWRQGSQATFRPSPDWRGQPDPFGAGTLPLLDEVRFRHVVEASTRTLLFEQGEIDRVPVGADAFARFLDATGKLKPEYAERGIVLQTTPNPDATFFMFNMENPIVGVIPGDEDGNRKRKLLRKAIASCLDYARWHRVIRNDKWATPSTSFLPPAVAEAQGVPPCLDRERNLDRARRYLAEAGWPEGVGAPELTFDQSDSTPNDDVVAEIFITSIEAIGLKCRKVINTWSRFNEKLGNQEMQLYSYAWTLDWPDALNLLQIFYGPSAEQGINYPNFRNTRFDELFQAARRLEPGDERTEIVHIMVAILNEELPAVPLDHRQGSVLAHPWLENHRIHDFATLSTKYFRIDPAKRKNAAGAQ